MIKTGVVGYGFSGKIFQCPFIEAHSDFELTGIVQRRGNECVIDYPSIIHYRSLDEMLLNKDLDLIVIATPAHLHFEHALKALRASKHVLIEKPFASTKEEVKILIETAKEMNKLVTVYQNRRFDSDFLTIKKLINSGVKVFEYEAIWDREKLNIDIDDWHEQGYRGSDNLFDLGTHFLDQAIHLFGKPLSVYGLTKALRPSSKIDDYFSMELEYEDKIVRLKSCMHAAKPGVRFKLHTDRGTYCFYKMDIQEPQLLSGMRPLDEGYGDSSNYDLFDLEGNKISSQVVEATYLMYFDMLANAINHNKPLPVSNEDGYLVISILEEVSKGNYKGSKL